jgi:hypothetical protein
MYIPTLVVADMHFHCDEKHAETLGDSMTEASYSEHSHIPLAELYENN